MFCFSFVKNFLLFFALVVIWNAVSPWEKEMWGHYFFIKNFLVVGIIGIITTFWFGIGGTRDLFRLFRDLEAKEDNVYDDGRVVNNMSVADIEAMKKAEGKDK